MNELNNKLFALLRSEICAEALDKGVLWDNDTLEALYALSKKHDLVHVVGAALDKHGLLTDGALAKKFGKHQMLAVYRYENQNYPLMGLPGWLSGKVFACQCRRSRRLRFDP